MNTPTVKNNDKVNIQKDWFYDIMYLELFLHAIIFTIPINITYKVISNCIIIYSF